MPQRENLRNDASFRSSELVGTTQNKILIILWQEHTTPANIDGGWSTRDRLYDNIYWKSKHWC